MRQTVKASIHLLTLVLLLSTFTLSGCFVHEHVIGNGSQTGQADSQRQWYVAFGLAALNEVDTNALAAGASNYEIRTEQTFIDGLIYAITGGIIGPRTVTVTR